MDGMSSSYRMGKLLPLMTSAMVVALITPPGFAFWWGLTEEEQQIRLRLQSSELSSSPLCCGSSMDAGVLALRLKISFATTKAIAMAASRKPRSSIADQASTSAFLSAVSLTSSVVASADLDLL